MLMKVLEDQSQMLKAALDIVQERMTEKVPFKTAVPLENDLSIHKQNKAQNKAEKGAAEKQLA